MRYAKLISFFLSLVLSIQVLPLQQISAWLSSGQVTEELPHDSNPVKANSGKGDGHSFYTLFDQADLHLTAAKIPGNENYSRDEVLHVRHADDILTPPPNS